MGHWVLRKDGPVHRAALTSAVQRLVQRHKAICFRVQRFPVRVFTCAC